MIKWIIGLNGAGKTVVLEETLDKEIEQGKSIVTNIRDVHYKGFDDSKVQALKESEEYSDIFDYGELQIINNKLEIVGGMIDYTEHFTNLLTLLCREGDTLIIDEPEFGLFGIEIDKLTTVLHILLPLYHSGMIATHCEELLSVEPYNFYWCEKYEIRKIGEKELYERIGQF